MQRKCRAIIERDGMWYVAHAPEIPGANGQGKTKRACLMNLFAAIALILQDRSIPVSPIHIQRDR